MVTDYPMIEKAKAMRVATKGEIEKHTKESWDGRGLQVLT